jgi:diguanylate cyclase (GGDEF)-like protein
VDRFKAVNDTHGHQVGDEVLVGLVRLITGNLRGHDILSRHGGDEFVVLAAHLGDADVGLLFERLRAAIADNTMLTRVGKLSITVSFGVSTWREGETEDKLLAAADSALYRAKNAGRDRVSLADSHSRRTRTRKRRWPRATDRPGFLRDPAKGNQPDAADRGSQMGDRLSC